MSTITIPIPDDDLRFLEAWTRDQGTTVEEYFTAQVGSLRRQESRPVHPALIRATGVIKPDVDAREAYLDHMTRKHA
ncbi:MAG TPA: hypothetical protein VGE39_22995 [Prosthecobacter sp.]